jgi:hypothetical protein
MLMFGQEKERASGELLIHFWSALSATDRGCKYMDIYIYMHAQVVVSITS